MHNGLAMALGWQVGILHIWQMRDGEMHCPVSVYACLVCECVECVRPICPPLHSPVPSDEQPIRRVSRLRSGGV